MAHPIDAIAAADVLVGVRPHSARQLLAVSLAASPEADGLLEEVPVLLRSLAVSTTSVPVRCDGEIRGPIMWSATMAARSSSPGAGGVWICANPVKAYDTDENRVLVAALGRIQRAAGAAEEPVARPHAPRPEDVRHARYNGERARRALEHRALQSVPRGKINGRMVFKARTGSKAAVFHPAVALIQRSWAEVGARDLQPFVDERTAAEHHLAADVADALADQGRLDAHLRLVDGWLVGRHFAYAHAGRTPGDDRRAGVYVDGQPVGSLASLTR